MSSWANELKAMFSKCETYAERDGNEDLKSFFSRAKPSRKNSDGDRLFISKSLEGALVEYFKKKGFCSWASPKICWSKSLSDYPKKSLDILIFNKLSGKSVAIEMKGADFNQLAAGYMGVVMAERHGDEFDCNGEKIKINALSKYLILQLLSYDSCEKYAVLFSDMFSLSSSKVRHMPLLIKSQYEADKASGNFTTSYDSFVAALSSIENYLILGSKAPGLGGFGRSSRRSSAR